MFKIAGGIILAVFILYGIDFLGYWIFGTDNWIDVIQHHIFKVDTRSVDAIVNDIVNSK